MTASESSSSSSSEAGGSSSFEEALEWEDWKGDIPFVHHAIAGSCAGIAEHVATFPLDTIKVCYHHIV